MSATPSQGTYDPVSGTWTVGSVAATQSAVLSITATVAQTGAFTNTATKTLANEDDPNPGNDSGSVTATAARVADLSVTKTDGLATVLAGGTDTYTIVVTNAGPTDVLAAPVSDTFPAALTGVTWSCTATDGGSCVASGSGDIATTVDLPAGSAATFTATGTVAPAAAGTLTNTAAAAPPAGTTDPDLGNNSGSDSTTIVAAADLAVSKSGPAGATAGTDVVFTIDVTNKGPSTATSVVVADPPPTGLAFVSNSGACLTPFPCSLGTLAPGATATITTTFHVPSGYTTPDPIVNQASVSSATPDPTPGNDTARSEASVATRVARLAIAKSNGVTSIVPGTVTTYTITVSNAGPSDVAGVSVADSAPAALENPSWTCSITTGGGSCTAAGGPGSIATTVSLDSGATATFRLTGTVAPGATGQLGNTATAQNPPGFSDPTSNVATDVDQLTPSADLSIAKTGPQTVVPGNQATYSIVVSNTGPSTATNVVVSDPTPSGLTFVSNSGACTTAFPCTLSPLAPNSAQTITTTLLVPPGYQTPNPIVEVASVSSTTPDPTAGNNSSTAQTDVDANADVEVTKSVAPTTGILVGDIVTFTVQAANHGPNAATGVVVTDMLPAGLLFVSASATQGTYIDSSGEWVVTNIAASQSAQLTIQALVTQPGTITNLAVKTGGNEPDPDPSNDSGAASINAAPAADVGIQKTVDNPGPSVGETVTFTVTATNRGPSAATGVSVQDAVPAGLALVSATPSQGAYDAGSGTWTVGDLGPTASATLILVASVNSTGMLVNVAQKTEQTEADPNPLNDQASVSINAVATADIQVGKAISTMAPAVGGDVMFTVTASNHGPSPATGVVVTDALPPGFTFVSATASDGTYDPSSGAWTVGNLAATKSAMLSITAHVTTLGPFTNTASRTAGNETDPNPADDSASVSSTTILVSDLSITKTNGQTLALPGDPVTYTITVSNAGPSDVTGASVIDPFPAMLAGVTWSCTATAGGSCGAASGTGDIATTIDLPATGVATFMATATVLPAATGVLANTASVAPPAETTDPDTNNNDATDPTDLTPSANLSITKSGPANTTPGDTVAYTIVVTNAGPSTATDVVVTDATPAGLTFASNSGDCATPFPCTFAAIAPSGSRTIIASYTVLPEAVSVANSASVMAATPDPDTSDNIASASTAIVPTPTTSTISTISSTTSTTSSTTSTTTTTTTSSSTTSSTTPPAEVCDNCLDDNGNGLIDAEDPACCAVPQALAITDASFRPHRSTLRVHATLADTTFAGLDPRQQPVQLQIPE